MSEADVFFDSNVLLYLVSGDPVRATQAEDLAAEGGTISVQVLNEFASVTTRKLKAPWPSVRETLDILRATLRVVPLTIETHDLGVTIAERYKLGLYDSLILAAAELSGCKTVYSEDMQNGVQINGRVTVSNPFKP